MRGKTAKLLRKLALEEANYNPTVARRIYKKFKKNWSTLKKIIIPAKNELLGIK